MYLIKADDVATDELRQNRKEVDFLRQAKENNGFGTQNMIFYSLCNQYILNLYELNFQFSI